MGKNLDRIGSKKGNIFKKVYDKLNVLRAVKVKGHTFYYRPYKDGYTVPKKLSEEPGFKRRMETGVNEYFVS